MRNTLLVGALVVGLMAPTAVIAEGAASTAGAASGLTCTHVRGNDMNFTFTLGGCGLPMHVKASGSDGLVTWSKGGGTTTFDDPGGYTLGGPNLCGKHDFIWGISGTVTGGTSPYTHVGDTVSITLCGTPYGRTSAMHELKGTQATI